VIERQHSWLAIVLLLGFVPRVAAQGPAAAITHPADGATAFETTASIQWNAVAAAQAYYLWVGTAPGLQDLINSGEIQATQYAASLLPANSTVHATLWTKVDNAWWSTSSAFTTSPHPRWLYPTDSRLGVTPGQTFSWTAVRGATAYYLWVGTTPNSNDVVNSGEIGQTEYVPTMLPKGASLHATAWSKVNATWHGRQITFSTEASPDWLYPTADSSVIDTRVPLRWSTVAGAQAYYLWVGTSPNTNDLVNTGEIQQTQYSASNLPPATTVYATVWARHNGTWWPNARVFTTSATPGHQLASRLLSPVDGTQNFDPSTALMWNATPSAEGYRIQVGSQPGFRDYLDSPVIHTTTYLATLPSGRRMYARLSTEYGGVWRYVDHEFTTMPAITGFVYPTNGQLGVSLARSFEWTPAIGADRYFLYVGTAPGLNDVYASGELTTLSHAVQTLPADRALYGTVWSRSSGTWRSSTIVFSLQTEVLPSELTYPTDGQTDVDFARAFEWQETHFAAAYRLLIGTAPGLSNLHDSGETRAPRRFVAGLPAGTDVFATLQTKIDGQWHSRQISFRGSTAGMLEANMWSMAQWLTGWVRAMAVHDRPYAWTPLFDAPWTWNGIVACNDFALQLISALSDANISLDTRTLNVEFTDLDNHVLVEVFRQDLGKWLVLDPTFGVTATTTNGSWATAQELIGATRSRSWNDISYLYLTDRGSQFVDEYYLDYPLLFLNSDAAVDRQSPASYLLPEATPVSGAVTLYTLQCASQATSVTASIDGHIRDVSCGADGFTAAFFAGSIETPAGHPAVSAYSFQRFVF
jgi:hypothetical protein